MFVETRITITTYSLEANDFHVEDLTLILIIEYSIVNAQNDDTLFAS